jgi:hypothetical protein
METTGMKVKKILTISGILFFFLGLPMSGLIYFWLDMHRKIEANAHEPTFVLAQTALATWDDETIGRNLGPEVDLDKMDAKVTEMRAKYGPLKTLSPGGNPKTWAHEWQDQTWQFARYDYPAVFEKGEFLVRFTSVRLYLEKEWKIADIEVLPMPPGG